MQVNEEKTGCGTLYVVATPIGNLGDLTPRAAETFAAADFVAAEDTRVTLRLLNHLGLKKPMVSYYEHNLRQRGEQILRDASVGAVGGEQGRQRADARHERNDEERQHAPAQPTLFRRIAEAVTTLFRASAQPGNDVLHHAQRTNDRTIYAPEDQGQGDKKHDDSHIQRQHGGQELDAGHPAQPSMHRPREVEEEQRDAGEEDDGQRQSDFT